MEWEEWTLHYEMAYRLQDHALDLSSPSTLDAMMISINSNKWLLALIFYDKSQQRNLSSSSQVHASLTMRSFVSHKQSCRRPHSHLINKIEDGSVEINFDKKETKTPTCFITQYIMITFAPTKVDVLSFKIDGTPIHAIASATGHKYLHVCTCQDVNDNDDEERKKA